MNLRIFPLVFLLNCSAAGFLASPSVAAKQSDTKTPSTEIPIAGWNGVSKPTCQKCPDPTYSREAKKAKHEGVAVLSIVVTSEGKVADIKIIRDPGEGLGAKAVEAVYKWRFNPAMVNGKAVTCRATIEIGFRLR